MPIFSFKIDNTGQEPVEKSRPFEQESDALAYARQLLGDWPDCEAIEVFQDGVLVDRLRPRRPQDRNA